MIFNEVVIQFPLKNFKQSKYNDFWIIFLYKYLYGLRKIIILFYPDGLCKCINIHSFIVFFFFFLQKVANSKLSRLNGEVQLLWC